MSSGALRRASRAVGWYLRQVSGQARWEEYVDRCRGDAVDPMSRREFERNRSDHKERHPQSGCC